MASAGNVKVIKLGSDVYELLAKYIQDGEGAAKQWSDIVDLCNKAKLDLVVVDTLPTASAETMSKIYLVAETGVAAGTYVEYVTLREGVEGSYTYKWERIGTTAADLASKADKGTYTSEVGGGHGHSVTGKVAVPTVGKTDKKLAATASGAAAGVLTDGQAVTAVTKTTDNVLGEDTTFAVDGGVASKTNIKATASGTAVGANGTAKAITALGTPTTADAITGFGTHTTADAITGFGAHTKDNALGEATTFSVSGGAASKTNIKATASGTAVGTENDDFVKSYPGATTNLVKGSVRGINGTANVPSSVSASTGSAASWSAAVDATGALTFSWTANTPTTVSVGSNVEVAKPAAAATDVITGLGAAGTGGTVMTGLGTAVTGKALTSASISAQPTIALATGATAGAGVISVATDVSAVTVAANKDDLVNAITGLGTPTTAKAITALGTPTTAKAITGFGAHTTADALTGVKVTAQPTIALATGATAGAGVVEVATDVSAVTVAANKNDVVAAVDSIDATAKDTFAKTVGITTQPTITLDGDAATGVAYVAAVTVGSEDVDLKNGAAVAVADHTHQVKLQ